VAVDGVTAVTDNVDRRSSHRLVSFVIIVWPIALLTPIANSSFKSEIWNFVLWEMSESRPARGASFKQQKLRAKTATTSRHDDESDNDTNTSESIGHNFFWHNLHSSHYTLAYATHHDCLDRISLPSPGLSRYSKGYEHNTSPARKEYSRW
jgi:hypothetical protein